MRFNLLSDQSHWSESDSATLSSHPGYDTPLPGPNFTTQPFITRIAQVAAHFRSSFVLFVSSFCRQFKVILCVGPVHDDEFLKMFAFILKADSLHFLSCIGSSQC